MEKLLRHSQEGNVLAFVFPKHRLRKSLTRDKKKSGSCIHPTIDFKVTTKGDPQ